jgi:hypothetical protein
MSALRFGRMSARLSDPTASLIVPLCDQAVAVMRAILAEAEEVRARPLNPPC